jgi:hypothetical protein
MDFSKFSLSSIGAAEEPRDASKKGIAGRCAINFKESLENARDNPDKSAHISHGCFGGINNLVSTSEEVSEYFEGLEAGRVISLNLSAANAALYSELVSDNIFLAGGLGYARVGVGALVSASDSTSTDTAEQFFQSGGNLSTYVAWPLLYWITLVRDGDTLRSTRRLDTFVVASAGADVPQLGESVETTAGNLKVGLQSVFVWNTVGEKIRFFFSAEGNYARGQDGFFDNLGVAEGRAARRQGFVTGKIGFGFDLSGLVRIGFSTGTSTVASQPLTVSAQLLPQ